MSDLFKPIKLNVPVPEVEPEPTPPEPEDLSGIDFKPLLKKIRQEMARIEVGTSELRRAMYFPKGNNPIATRLEAFEKDPLSDTLVAMVKVARQDYGAVVSDVFITWIREVLPSFKARKKNE